ncbi:MAG: hypothetical protein B7Y12_02155 [Rhizobiales bacterium 24-66-13]|jgi:hypothetical protein|nr:MAG: hypothetical protein B7Y61_01185 [Rhizobiales bacterium 35-66-30]OYZ82818.1 MAG: hypothetical protein B7Y12_02155 [Rhizobiales bacterium 24-66-13]OZB11851.1 MAG: hypothetical protein B7X67_02135 [Rhizobiales bacterium 39-66-18]HQS08724.1 hypothetical protein [Xanthobacteraceae bacterium]HQS45925.1 hypothetical protein [Xanthobacteraceae bacterium]
MAMIRITCARPGFRRLGIEHGANKDWPSGHFSAEELDALRDEPLLTVTDVPDDVTPSQSYRLIEGLGACLSAEDFRRAGIILGAPGSLAGPRYTPAFTVATQVPGELVERLIDAAFDALASSVPIDEFRQIAADICLQHGWISPEGRSGTAREAPSADSGPEGEATAEPEGGVQPAAPQNTEGAAPADAVAPGAAATLEGASGQVDGEGDTSPPLPAGEGGKGEEGAAQSPSEPAPFTVPPETAPSVEPAPASKAAAKSTRKAKAS